MPLSVPADAGRALFEESAGALLKAVDGLSELELFEASRCRGWTRLDVVVHVLAGWQEVLGGLVSVVEDAPTVDAATFWTAFTSTADADPVGVLMEQRRRTATYARPSAALAQLQDVARAVRRGVHAAPAGNRLWWGEVFTLGDFFATWAVEHVVHHLDLRVSTPPSPTSLTLARESVEVLAGGVLPTTDDVEAVLVGTGRLPVPTAWDAGWHRRLPAFG
ncbi:maleylpyruvate isomerase N-terminal domain-containing protein [Pseudokineococcus sp. 1T1Z-3]|uniref:maleylpyruvate isomerase N-terminal domain-containing protein n=1 Tax=Pseudokineococcus sp. 1T1Z-3 TaxID=3132745 RepID=UPI0030A76681